MIDQSEEKWLSAGELARQAGVSTDTLRHYEAKGVIKRPPRRANGYRSYPLETLQRVRLIRRSLAIGFSLDELTEILRIRDGGGAPCRRVRELATKKLDIIEQRLRDLIALRDELRVTLNDWDARLAKTPPHRRARLLEGLNIEPTSPSLRAPFTTTARNKNGRNK